MSEPRFTKGEWEVTIYESETKIDLWSGDDRIYHKDINIADNEWRAEQVANAHLIAAAPEMYEMLENIHEILDDEFDGVKFDIRELLAKARGEK